MDIEGSGENVTIIRRDGSRTVRTADKTEMRFLTVENNASSGACSAIESTQGGSSRFRHVTLRAKSPVNPSGFSVGNIPDASFDLSDVTVIVEGGINAWGIGISQCNSVRLTNVVTEATANTGGSVALLVGQCSLAMNNFTVTSTAKSSDGDSVGIRVENDGANIFLNHGQLTAQGGHAATGVMIYAPSILTIRNAEIVASGAQPNTGTAININASTGSVTVHNDALSGTLNSVYAGGQSSIVRIGGSHLAGPLSEGSYTRHSSCASCYDDSFAPLNGLCQPLP